MKHKKSERLNYLLVMPRLVRKVGDSYGFPLGIAYISSCLKKAGYRVTTLNLNHCEGELSEILKGVIEQNHIRVVMTGALSAQYGMARAIVETAKTLDPGLITVVGGGLITSDPETAMDALEHADIGVIGEGEVTSVELCRALEAGGDLAQVDGLIYKPGVRSGSAPISAGYVVTGRRKEIVDIDSIPWPDYHGFELEKNLAATLGTFGFNDSNTLSMISSRSCPYSCTFCFHTVGRKYRQRSLDGFFTELDHLVANYNISSLALSDELIARDFNRLKEFCTRIKKYNIGWLGGFRVDDITPEMLPLLKESNCITMGFGLESADNRILKSMRKGITLQQIETTLKMVHEAGISISGGFIFGDIEETLETANNTLRWWEEHPEYGTSLRLITAFPGTHIYNHACERGVITDRVRFLRDGCPQVNVSRMSDQEFQDFTKKMMETSFKHAKTLTSFRIDNVDETLGCVDITGECSVCGSQNDWEGIRLFRPTFIKCRSCGQQFTPPLDEGIRAGLDANMAELLARHGKVALWGMTHHAVDILQHSALLRGPNVFPIDICQSKQSNDFCGTRIYGPEILSQEDIKTVVVTAPYHISCIEAQIATGYKNVEQIIVISGLIKHPSCRPRSRAANA